MLRTMLPGVDVTTLLSSWQRGDEAARDELFSIANQNMRDIARNILRNDRSRQHLQPTELVNECVLRMFGIRRLDWRDRAHFIAVASTTMRRILVDEARRKKAAKRDGLEVTYFTDQLGGTERSIEIEALDKALQRLGEASPDLVRVVELKYFGGLSNDEVAAVMDVSPSTIKRHWRTARTWLYQELSLDQ